MLGRSYATRKAQLSLAGKLQFLNSTLPGISHIVAACQTVVHQGDGSRENPEAFFAEKISVSKEAKRMANKYIALHSKSDHVLLTPTTDHFTIVFSDGSGNGGGVNILREGKITELRATFNAQELLSTHSTHTETKTLSVVVGYCARQ